MKLRLLLLIALSVLLIPGLASAGCLISIINLPQEKTLTMDVNWQTPYGSAFGSTQDGYVVPLDSKMIFKNIASYTVHCEDGDNADVKPPLRVKITNSSTGITITKILDFSYSGYWCSNVPGCTACSNQKGAQSVDPVDAFFFDSEGLYNVRVEFAKFSVDPNALADNSYWLQAQEDFNVLVFSPLLAVHGSKKTLLPLTPGQTTQAEIIWTVRNLSQITIKIQDINMPLCNANGLSCSLMPQPSGIQIKPNEHAIFTQIIKLENPPASYNARDLNMFLDVNFSDIQGIYSFKKTSEPTLLKIKPLSQQEFSIKIKGAGSNICYGLNGKTGYTGTAALPKIKLSWEWNSIEINECDKDYTNPSQDFKYCDGTQFSIELLKKLQRIDELSSSTAQATTGEAAELQSLKNFSAFLIKDGYSKDLIEDLSNYLIYETLADQPAWFSNADYGFSRLFTDSNKFKILLAGSGSTLASAVQLNALGASNASLLEPGLYELLISTKYYDEAQKTFILAGEANADINVYLIKVSSPLQDSAFYYLPFDGAIGYNSTTQRYERQGYGVKVSGKDLVLLEQGAERVQYLAKPGDALNSLTVQDENSLDYLQKIQRGSVFNILRDAASFTLTRSPSNATPALMRIKQGAFTASTLNATSEASAFYYLVKDASTGNLGTFITSSGNLSYWTGVSSNMRSSSNSVLCQDFLSRRLFNYRQDGVLSTQQGASCNLVSNVPNDKVYGFSWTNIPQESSANFLYLQTVFYTSKNSNYGLYNACENKDYQIVTPTGNNDISRATGRSAPLPLDYDSSISLSTLQEILNAVQSEALCFTTNSTLADFWWNESKLFEALHAIMPDNSDFKLNKCMIQAFQSP